jgi:antitoxin MazE
MRAAVRKFGNSTALVLPEPLLAALGATVGEDLTVTVETGRVVIEQAGLDPRVGWAEDAARLAAEGDDGLVSPEFRGDT